MRILHCVSSIENLSAGTTYSVQALSTSLVRQGVSVELYSLGDQESAAISPFRDLRYARDFEEIPFLSRLGLSSKMRRAIMRSDADIFHIHGLWMLPNCYPAVAARANSKPLVLSPHGMLGKEALQYSRGRKRLAWALWQGPAAKQVSCFRATCVEEFHEIRSFGLNQPVAIIPNGIDLPPKTPVKKTPNLNRVVTLGRIHPKKGLDRLIRAWALIESQHPDWQLEIVGPSEGNHQGELEALSFGLGLRNVKFSGPVFGDEKWQLLTDAEVFVLPTLNENFAMTVAESLACETPVISTKGAPWAGLETNDCGWWIDHGHENLAAALHKAFSLSPEHRKAMGARGREWMRREFAWGAIGAQMHEVYAWLLGQQERPECVLS